MGQKDAEQFSVKGKMKMSTLASDVPKAFTPPLTPDASLTPPDLSPGCDRRKKTPKPLRFQSKTGKHASLELCTIMDVLMYFLNFIFFSNLSAIKIQVISSSNTFLF